MAGRSRWSFVGSRAGAGKRPRLAPYHPALQENCIAGLASTSPLPRRHRSRGSLERWAEEQSLGHDHAGEQAFYRFCRCRRIEWRLKAVQRGQEIRAPAQVGVAIIRLGGSAAGCVFWNFPFPRGAAGSLCLASVLTVQGAPFVGTVRRVFQGLRGFQGGFRWRRSVPFSVWGSGRVSATSLYYDYQALLLSRQSP